MRNITLLSIEGMRTGEEVFAWLFIMFVFVIGFFQILAVMRAPVKERKLFNEPEETTKSKSKKVNFAEYAFDYSLKNNIFLKYYGDAVLYATIVSDKVYFFWQHNNKQAAPVLKYNPERMKAVETVLMTAHKKSLKVLNKRTTGEAEKWDIINPQHEVKKTRRSYLDIELS